MKELVQAGPSGRACPAKLFEGSVADYAKRVGIKDVQTELDLGPYVHEPLTRNGVVPMQDVLLVAGGRDVIQRHLEPEPVLVDIKPRAIGQLAVQLLLARLAMPDTPRATHLVEPDLILPGS